MFLELIDTFMKMTLNVTDPARMKAGGVYFGSKGIGVGGGGAIGSHLFFYSD
jgi:hypothetical protein